MTPEAGPALGALLSALSDSSRRQILDLVADAGPRSATDLAAHLPVSRQAIAKHLAILENAGLVRSERCGKEIRYQLVAEPLSEVKRWLDRTAARWDQSLLALKHAAEESGD